MKNPLRLGVCVFFLCLVTGCIPILIHSAVEANSMEKQAYSAYLDNMRTTNTQREVAGLAVQPVLSREEWAKTVRYTNAPTPVMSPNDPRRK